MTQEQVDAEIERSRAFIHALIDVRFELRRKNNPYRPISKAYPLPISDTPPQLHNLWGNRDEFEQRPGAMFQEAVRIHPDRTWTWQPTAGVGYVYSDVVMHRTYRTIYGCRHSVTPWILQEPSGMKEVFHP